MQKKKTSWLESATLRLLAIFIVLLIVTMVLSSGVLKGKGFAAMFTKGFMTTGNVRSILYSLVIKMMMMCGLALILIGGNIDLSVSTQATLAICIFAKLCADTTIPWGILFVISLLIACCFGLINSFLVLKLHFPAFIATIGMSSVYRGLAAVITENYNVNIARNSFVNISKVTLFNLIPITFIIAGVFIFIFQFILSKTRFGRNCFAAGGNRIASRLAGVNISKMTIILFLINSIMGTLGGMMWAMQYKMASPTSIISAAPDMSCLSAVMLGGVAFSGGTGGLGGPFIALAMLAVLDNLLTILGVGGYWNVFAQGALLIVALIFDYVSQQKRRKALLASAE